VLRHNSEYKPNDPSYGGAQSMDLQFSFAYAVEFTDAIVNLGRGAACLKTLGIPRRHGHAWRNEDNG
jgi:hypothetical protein